MGTRLYVGNLPTHVEEELQEVFGQVGTVANVAIIIDRETGVRVDSALWRWRRIPPPPLRSSN